MGDATHATPRERMKAWAGYVSLPEGGDGVDRVLTSLRRGIDALTNVDAAPGPAPAPAVAIQPVAQQISRPNVVAVMSPKGGVGKTTCTLLAGSVLAGPRNLRVLAVDAGGEPGTLCELVPRGLRAERPLEELLECAGQIASSAQLRPFVSCMPSGLHVLAAPREETPAAWLTPAVFASLVEFLAVFYEVVLLDMGTGLLSPGMSFAVERADHLVVVTTPENVTASVVARGISRLPLERTTVVINMAQPGTVWDDASIARVFRDRGAHATVTVPFDEDLLVALDTGTFALDALDVQTRAAVEQFGGVVAGRLA